MTTLEELRRRLLASPPNDRPLDPAVEDAILDSIRYLGSDAAQRSLDADVYWPKWHSPWWHMLLLHEIGQSHRIPERIVMRMVERLQAFPVKILPIWPGELPAGASPHRDVMCHCALGSVVQVLAACGRDVDRELPWIRPWFVRYQMADGGLNCDETAYRCTDECPSSMVGTLAPFEAMLLGDPGAWSAEHAGFVARGAGFLIERQLMQGSPTVHNADERQRARAWLLPAFPRFYYYDVVRGLGALVRWAEVTGEALPLGAIAGVVDHLLATFPDGVVRLGRRSYEGIGTWVQSVSGAWVRELAASRFPLLDATSAIGRPCPYTTRQWSAARRSIANLIEGGRILGR